VASRSLTTEQILTMLGAAPAHIAELTAGLSPAQLRAAPARDEWSANEVLAHLRACADRWGNAIIEMLTHNHPTLRAINPRTWIEKTDYREQAFAASLKLFSAQRADFMAALEPLDQAGWSRAATVTGAGKPLELTVLSYGERLALHERPHLKQIARIAGTMRKEQ
jgi:hypothetical protein